jgi:hypothetical protein
LSVPVVLALWDAFGFLMLRGTLGIAAS